jgi:hypothetical protein
LRRPSPSYLKAGKVSILSFSFELSVVGGGWPTQRFSLLRKMERGVSADSVMKGFCPSLLAKGLEGIDRGKEKGIDEEEYDLALV